MENINYILETIKKKVDYAEKSNKDIQIHMLYDIRSNLIKTLGEDKESKIYIYHMGRAEGIAEGLQKYFDYHFGFSGNFNLWTTDTSPSNVDKGFGGNFVLDMKKIEIAITKISGGEHTFAK